MTKILIISLKNNKNIGDVIINECTEYLINNILSELNIKNYKLMSTDMIDEDYSLIPCSNLIIFTGGGIIKYRYQEFYKYMDIITMLADLYNIPVIFNAVGIEGYDDTNKNCIIIKNSLNRECVKQITTRDDFKLLCEKYIEKNHISLGKVADPAVWTDKVYNINKKNNKGLVGLGVLREGIFHSNGINIGLEDLILFWKNIIDDIESIGLDWKIFTTGWPSDMKFAINLMKAIGRKDEVDIKVLPEPKSSYELVSNISIFEGIISGRLHSHIIAYSLKIPSVGLVWNDKCVFWGEIIKFPQRFFKHDKFNSKIIVNEYVRAVSNGYIEDEREEFRWTVYESLKNYLHNFFINSTLKIRI